MANNEIGYKTQNVTNKVIAERVLKEFKDKIKDMKSKTHITKMNGRVTWVTKYYK